ncbi:hypothetical protein ILYODFUR_030456 [Ilyodon furcidens]|uniref:Secreted protein n=1 Tax=Ilyodon furcidens TaxID=33524 RepID=A0ABV0SQU4_9TELE
MWAHFLTLVVQCFLILGSRDCSPLTKGGPQKTENTGAKFRTCQGPVSALGGHRNYFCSVLVSIALLGFSDLVSGQLEAAHTTAFSAPHNGKITQEYCIVKAAHVLQWMWQFSHITQQQW